MKARPFAALTAGTSSRTVTVGDQTFQVTVRIQDESERLKSLRVEVTGPPPGHLPRPQVVYDTMVFDATNP